MRQTVGLPPDARGVRRPRGCTNASATLRGLQAELRGELTCGILPFWMERAMDERHGGVVGFVAADGARRLDAPKGSILHARVLWTFSAAHRLLGDRAALAHAGHLAEHFRS